mmetsp:Transcript_152114/g.268563  ORF Transcript_152114/g.268563 Transcript_152114/m.268563 type:complete len:919 (+) Transcript_152114:129-2885(+)
MQVPEEWDRPQPVSGQSSYYPALRFPGLGAAADTQENGRPAAGNKDSGGMWANYVGTGTTAGGAVNGALSQKSESISGGNFARSSASTSTSGTTAGGAFSRTLGSISAGGAFSHAPGSTSENSFGGMFGGSAASSTSGATAGGAFRGNSESSSVGAFGPSTAFTTTAGTTAGGAFSRISENTLGGSFGGSTPSNNTFTNGIASNGTSGIAAGGAFSAAFNAKAGNSSVSTFGDSGRVHGNSVNASNFTVSSDSAVHGRALSGGHDGQSSSSNGGAFRGGQDGQSSSSVGGAFRGGLQDSSGSTFNNAFRSDGLARAEMNSDNTSVFHKPSADRLGGMNNFYDGFSNSGKTAPSSAPEITPDDVLKGGTVGLFNNGIDSATARSTSSRFAQADNRLQEDDAAHTRAPPAWPEGSGRPPASPQQQASTAQISRVEESASFSLDDGGKATAAKPVVEQNVEVRGKSDMPGPWKTWLDVSFPDRIRGPLVAAGFPAPTPIQQHSWPIVAGGHDMIGIAKTGSGKTLAFLLPGFASLLESRADPRAPPAILVLAPTRELACQIENEAKQFGRSAGMKAVCLYGGAPKGPQLAELRLRPQLVVATPGRLNDLLEPPAGMTLAVDVKSVRFLVLDEADRMLDMGFEPQIRKIISALPQERQTLMFTATWPPAVRRLASEFTREPAEVRIGEVEQLSVNADIDQRVVFCRDQIDRQDRLDELLRDSGNDQAIVFTNTKRMCDSIGFRIPSSVVIHGDKDQRERDTALSAFKSGAKRVLVATDVAARGLDIRAVKLVVNFEPPNREEEYVHRVGRTGRAGQKGTAVTLLTNEDGTAARFISEVLKRMSLPVPQELEQRLASGEMRTGGGRDRSVSRPRMARRGPDMSFGGDDMDFGDVGPGRFSGRFGGFGRDNDFMNDCTNDCPTY